ncbi:UNVERIFIED_CONTAM: hypothetical protein FKN15_061171 [Acipenser sinensis]
MAEAQTSGELELNPDAADFVPGERQSQFQSRSRPRPDFSRNRGGRYAAPHQQRYNRSYCNDEPLHERGCYNRQTYRTWEAPLDSRDGPSARGNHSFQNQRQNRSRNIRTFPTDHSRPLGGSHSESFTEKPDNDGPSWRTEDKRQNDFKNGFGPEDTRDARPKNPRKFTYEMRRGPGERGKPALYRDNREDLIEGDRENSLEMGSVEAAKVRSNESALKHSHYGNKRAAQGSQRQWQQNKDEHQTRQERSRSTKPQSASSQADRKVNEMVSSGKTREPDSRSSWRSDVERGQGRRMPLQDHGPKKLLSSDRTPFCKKQLDVPKSKETHTGCLIEQLTEEKYECMVCCEVIRVMAPVWSCQSCYHVFHLNCIKKWARSPASQAEVCYCGISSREVPCGTDKEHFDESGHFSCQKLCGKMLDCGKHTCLQVCHPQPCQSCPRLPKVVRSCPCGQTPLSKLLELGYPERKSCTDTIPSCGKTCAKPLPCGSNDSIHLCENLCHEKECGPCSLTSTIKCRCGFKTKEVPCAVIQNEADFMFMCDKRCNKKRTCGRHKCNELCCVDKEHKCSMICGYKLNCGQHRCQELCHRGNCHPCWQTSFDELTCHCGETVIYPPVPCGTRPPECKNPCTRKHECDHPVFHNCHSEEKCPPCTYLTQKWCMGKHEVVLQCDCGRKKESMVCSEASSNYQRIAAIAIASRLSDMQLGDSVEIGQLITKKEMKQARLQCDEECAALERNRDHRKIIHELAEVYGIESESYDSEPKRNIIITAVRGKTSCPNTTLTTLIERETATRPPPPIAHHRQHIANSGNCSVMQKVVKEEPVIDYFDVQD